MTDTPTTPAAATQPDPTQATAPAKRDVYAVQKDIDLLHGLATDIDQHRPSQFPDLIERLQKDHGLKVAFRKTQKVHRITLAGVHADHWQSPEAALGRWPAAARRRILELEKEQR